MDLIAEIYQGRTGVPDGAPGEFDWERNHPPGDTVRQVRAFQVPILLFKKANPNSRSGGRQSAAARNGGFGQTATA